MGAIFRGIPPALALELKRRYALRYFVETGTLIGKTSEWAAQHFDRVYTIEMSARFNALAKRRLVGLHNVWFLLGDSRTVLPRVLAELPGPALVWLDAHWSPDLKEARAAGADRPALAEIRAIAASPIRCVTLIDDARLFTGRDGWPTVADVESAFGCATRIENDVIICEGSNGRTQETAAPLADRL